jgi:hypothetical protein
LILPIITNYQFFNCISNRWLAMSKSTSVDSLHQKLSIDVFFVDIQSFVGISKAETIDHTIIST